MNMQPKAPMASQFFNKAATGRSKAPRTKPFPVRFTDEERAILEARAGNQFLVTYIRDQLLGEEQEPRRRLRNPGIDDQKASALLAALGNSRLSSNLNQLARQANMGTLDFSVDTEKQLQDACKAVLAMRKALFVALGLKPE